MQSRTSILREMGAHATRIARRAHVPYSNRHEATVILLADGACIPGVRVESATFSLTIPSVVNAVAAAMSNGRVDVVALVQSRSFLPGESAYLLGSPFDGLVQTAADAYAISEGDLPEPRGFPDPGIKIPIVANPEEGIRAARSVAVHAYAPESDFAVGCVVETADGVLVPGVNVENRDWTRILCAERSALGAVISYGLGTIKTMYVSCLQDATGTPCGACRQLLSELAPQSTLWMDRGDRAPASSDPITLLPGSFTGSSIQRSSG